MALLEIGNVRPSDGDGVGARGERDVCVGVEGKEREERKSIALPHGRRGTTALPKTVGVSYNLYDSLYIRYGHMSPIYHDEKQIISTDQDHDT